VSQSFWVKCHQKSCRSSQCLSCYLIFCIKVRVEVDYVGRRIVATGLPCSNSQGWYTVWSKRLAIRAHQRPRPLWSTRKPQDKQHTPCLTSSNNTKQHVPVRCMGCHKAWASPLPAAGLSHQECTHHNTCHS
jgi:hypothetical protein